MRRTDRAAARDAGPGWTIDTLRHWDQRIREQVESSGLACFPQEFEICDQNQMLGYMAYAGMPAHYPHWSFGKRFEKLKTLHDVGATGLPYEMVINANPSLAYLMKDNSLCQQILTMAHVYGHNDFFRNNVYFGHTHPELVTGAFKLRAERVRDYIEDPSIGLERVEAFLDAAHALSLHVRRHAFIRKASRAEQEARALRRSQPPRDPHASIHPPAKPVAVDLERVPLEPEEDLLLFIRDHSTYLADWQKDVLTIVDGQARYFLPQIQTKIMNEGWASFWHHRILNALALPQGLHLEFLVHHNQVIRPQPGGLNPYHVGYRLWQHIHEEHGEAALFEVREVDSDVSFLRRFLDERLMRELDLYEYAKRGNQLVVSRVADEEHWRDVKATLLNQVGVSSVPVIRVLDADYDANRTLLLEHAYDGRELESEYAMRTLAHVRRLWGRRVLLDTVMGDERLRLSSEGDPTLR